MLQDGVSPKSLDAQCRRLGGQFPPWPTQNLGQMLQDEAQLHFFLVYLQHCQHYFVNENVDLLVSADQINAYLLSHRV